MIHVSLPLYRQKVRGLTKSRISPKKVIFRHSCKKNTVIDLTNVQFYGIF
jgi:hypothetical protein